MQQSKPLMPFAATHRWVLSAFAIAGGWLIPTSSCAQDPALRPGAENVEVRIEFGSGTNLHEATAIALSEGTLESTFAFEPDVIKLYLGFLQRTNDGFRVRYEIQADVQVSTKPEAAAPSAPPQMYHRSLIQKGHALLSKDKLSLYKSGDHTIAIAIRPAPREE